MFNKFDLAIGGLSVFFMALAIYLVQVNNVLFSSGTSAQQAQVIQANEPGIVVVTDEVTAPPAEVVEGNTYSMVINDIKVGTGAEVKDGDTVSVHYTGTLNDGQEFDSSKNRGIPFEFKVGAGQVIEGWEKGLVGMKVGGERSLVIPPEMGYGAQGIGPIPPNSTLLFTIELLDIK